MALSPPVSREPLHRREITLHGYRRTDGLFDVEAHLVDTKAYAFTLVDRGEVPPGVPLHEMRARMTVDQDMLIVAFEAATEHGPYAICPQAAPNFARLAGLVIGPGFLKAANARVGGTVGCTHLRELLQQMGTVAFQTLYAVRRDGEATPATAVAPARPPMLETCLAYATDSPVVRRDWPDFYTGPDAA
jgi:hypothetical protein